MKHSYCFRHLRAALLHFLYILVQSLVVLVCNGSRTVAKCAAQHTSHTKQQKTTETIPSQKWGLIAALVQQFLFLPSRFVVSMTFFGSFLH